jgi:hypothetical protein
MNKLNIKNDYFNYYMAYAKRPTFRRKANPKAKKPLTAKKAVATAARTNFNKRVLQVINRNSETKMKIVEIFSDQDITGFGMKTVGGATQGVSNRNILSTIALAQGTEQEQRIGNEVGSCKLRLRGYVQSNVYSNSNASLLPFEVHMVVYKRKKSIDNTFDIIKSLPSNTTGEIDNTIMNTLMPFNKDSYIIKKHRVFRMRPPAANTGTNTINAVQSDDPMFRRFQQDINISNTLKYSDQLEVPSNDWVGVLFYVINGDGGIWDGTGTSPQRAKVNMQAVLTYKDD